MAEKLSDKLKGLFKRADTSLGKGVDRLKSYPGRFKKVLKEPGATGELFKKIVGKGAITKKPKLSTSKALTVFNPKKALPATASKFAKATKTAGKFGKLKAAARVASRVALPLTLGVEGASLAYKVATLSPEKKAKVKKLKSKLSKKSTKQSHADLLKMSTGGDTMLKGGQKKLDKNKDGKISGEDFKMMKARVGKSVESPGSKANKLKLAKQNLRKTLITKLRGAQVGPAEEAKVSDMSMSEMNKKLAGYNTKKTIKIKNMYKGGESKGYGAARTQGEGLQDENLIPGKSLDYYKDIM